MIAGLGVGGGDGIGVGVAQADGGEEVAGGAVGEPVEDHVLVDAVRLGLVVGADVGNLQVGEFQ